MQTLPSGTVTLLFTDIEASTRLLQELGEQRFNEALGEHRRVLREAFAAHDGIELRTEGDSFFAAFASARDALAAAAEAQRSLHDRPVQVRIGIHTGEPMLVSHEDGYVGVDVHRAARICAAGHGGQVLLSQFTRDLLDPNVRLLDLGEHRLKDLAEPVRLFQFGSETFPPLKTISNTNLPQPASSFVGRERELKEVASLLRDGARLVTLSGSGGSGKTRLALKAAAELVGEFKAGVFWIGLAALREPALVTETIAQMLGAQEELAGHIGDRQLLLLLDNLEQVIEAASELASLVESCPNLKLLVTSRERLRVRGEVDYPVPPLAQREAVDLFSARSRLEPDDEIAVLCSRLDNLPLAVELAAARTSALSPAQILERLSQRLDLLKGGRDTEARQQTLRATVDWSYDLLSPEEQRLFSRVSIFAGGCTLEGAEAVADADLDTLHSLVDKSLIHRGEDAIGEPRFSMLETVREYAAEQLEHSGEAENLMGRHLDWFLMLAEEAEIGSRSGDEENWFDRLEPDHDNLRAALASARQVGENELELRLATALWRFWARRGYVSEGQRSLEEALEKSPTKPLPARLGRCCLGWMTSSSFAEMLSETEAIAAACEPDRDRFTRVQALRQIGTGRIALGNFTSGELALTEAITLSAGDYPAEEAEAIGWLLIAAVYGPLPAEQGITRCRDAYEHAEGNKTVQAFALVERSALEAMRGEFDTAHSLLSDGRDIFREVDLKVFGANTAQEGYFVEMLAGNPAAAAADLRAAYELLAEMGERAFLSTIAGFLAHACYVQGELEDAERYVRVCADAAAEDDFLSQSLWRSARAKLLARDRAFDRALNCATEAVELLQRTEQINARADRLTDLAEVLHLAGQPAGAADALHEAVTLYDQKGNLISARGVKAALAEPQIPATPGHAHRP